MSFVGRIVDETKRLSLEGHVVLGPVACSTLEGIDHHDLLVDLHKEKLLMCDYAFVLNVGGYIGDGGRDEIEFCKEHSIPVKYLESIEDNIDKTHYFGMDKGEAVKTMIYKGRNPIEAMGCFDMLSNKKERKEPMLLTGTGYSVQVLDIITRQEENIFEHYTDYEVSFKGIVL